MEDQGQDSPTLSPNRAPFAKATHVSENAHGSGDSGPTGGHHSPKAQAFASSRAVTFYCLNLHFLMLWQPELVPTWGGSADPSPQGRPSLCPVDSIPWGLDLPAGRTFRWAKLD